jgi:L-histidine N-alpha-methyltransferase
VALTALDQTAHRSAVDEHSAFARDVLAGLSARRKTLPPKYFYDRAGSLLFERITGLPEYYPTRTEIALLHEHAAAIAEKLPERGALIEFGSGSSRKVRLLLAAAPRLAAYVPVDISPELMNEEAARLRAEFPAIQILPLETDFTQPFELPAAIASLPRAGLFPGSTIGNFEPYEACSFLAHAGRMLGDGAVLIVGVDLIKDRAVLHAAYNDAAGVTAQFNLNLLARMNRELGANFNLGTFEHHAFYNPELHRIEMHLASVKRQKVRLCGETIDFRAGETIHTENSYKYTVASFQALAKGSGWSPLAVWTDADQYFSLHLLARQPSTPVR